MLLQLTNRERIELQRLCALSEKRGALTPAVLRMIYRKKWFKLFIPKEQGGLAATLPDALKLEEQLAAIDGSLGWTITLCAGANFFAGFMDPQKTGKLFHAKNVCMGGSGAATGIAVQTKDGYVVTGKWKYATGAAHLTHFTVNCIIEKDGETVLQNDGNPLVRSFYFKRNEVRIYKDWNAMGLKATSSCSFSVKNRKIKKELSFLIDHAQVTLSHPVYRYPFMPFAETTLAVNTLGMLNHLLDEATAIITQKKLNNFQYQLANDAIQGAREEVRRVRNAFYLAVEMSWNELVEKKKISPKTERHISAMSRQLVEVCRQHATVVYPYCGLAKTAHESDINRCFRDLFTASQHALLTYGK